MSMDRFASVEWIAKTADVRVRVMTLAPGEGTPWHLNGSVTDYAFGLEDGVQLALRGPDETIALAPGQRHDVAPGRVHRLVNTTSGPARYLLVQATGPYDFIEVE